MVVVKNGHGLFGLRTQKYVLSWEWIDEMTRFFAYWYKFRKVNSYFDNYWVSIVKNEGDLMDHGTLKLGVSLKWFHELSRLIEQFMHGDIDG